MTESHKPPASPTHRVIHPAPVDLTPFRVKFFMMVDTHLSRPVMAERPDGLVVILHLRHGIDVATTSQHARWLLTPAEQLPWRAVFRVPLSHRIDPMEHLDPVLRSLIACPEVIPPGVALTE